MKYVMGLDIGTTSAKAILFKRNGTVVAENEQSYSIQHPKNGWAEQDPLKIEQATIRAIQHITKKIHKQDLLAVGLSTAMHSLICMDQNGQPLSNAIIWADTRSSAEAEQLKANQASIYLATGTPLHPMSPLAKLNWMKNVEYKPFIEADYFGSVKEFLLFHWFGEKVVDYAMAASTGLFNIHDFKWDSNALSKAGITENQLSQPISPYTKLSMLRRDIADRLGISVDTPFIIGGSDGPLANLGIGAFKPGETAITIGTSGAIRQFADKPLLNSHQEVFSYAFTKDLWITGGPTNNGGIVLQWVKNLISNDTQHYTMDDLNELAQKVAAGSENLLFLPYLNGERAPFWDAKAKGSFIGLQSHHKKEHVVRASMEGVVYSIYHIGHALEHLGNRHDLIYASGGFARSSLWLQILADTFGKPVKIPESHQSSAWGAAWIALCAVEGYQLKDIKDSIPMKGEIEPNLEHTSIYQQHFEIYQKLYHTLKDTFYELDKGNVPS
ncbi:gluconokinase [Tenuibacillus multivorans]|uniref:Gluconokinase n=1 Tax=Tenuibacillus multivorans TaxID=237069 RepID=A0A1H0C2H5_9BACI|nr:gluconokinase [Tenuibacillus multivorans]GEL77742.1 gluconate kinase [Tenuibacillus multivorans]SDN52091.1 gluconokinase [Tenuibacillus multivorans]